MKVSCPSCQTNYNIDEKRIPAGGAKLKCAKCQTTFPIRPGTGATGAPSVPLPAGTQAVPLPSAGGGISTGAAVPLPSSQFGADFQGGEFDAHPTQVVRRPDDATGPQLHA